MFTAKLLDGTLFQDPSPLCIEFLANATTLYTQPKHRPFLIITLLHPETGEKVSEEELLSPDLIYYLLFDYHTVRPWMREDLINVEVISTIPEAIRHLEKHKEQINYKLLSSNPAAGELLWERRDEPDCFDWPYLCKNPSAVRLMELHPTYVHWPNACVNQNPDILSFLQKYLQYVNWSSLSTNPVAIPLLLKYPQNINWTAFSSNPAAIPYLLEHPDRINLRELCKNPNAIDLLIDRMDQFIPVDWKTVSLYDSPYIDRLLERIPISKLDMLDWRGLSMNPSAIEFVIQHKRVESYWFIRNQHPDIIQYCRRVFPNFSIHQNHYAILRNPSAVDYIEQNLNDWLSTNQRLGIWEDLSYNPAIYCPPLD